MSLASAHVKAALNDTYLQSARSMAISPDDIAAVRVDDYINEAQQEAL